MGIGFGLFVSSFPKPSADTVAGMDFPFLSASLLGRVLHLRRRENRGRGGGSHGGGEVSAEEPKHVSQRGDRGAQARVRALSRLEGQPGLPGLPPPVGHGEGRVCSMQAKN